MAMMYKSEIHDLLFSSMRDIDYLYSKLDKLSYSSKGTLLVTIVQFILASNIDRGTAGSGKNEDKVYVTINNVIGAYSDDESLKLYILEIVTARNDYCHRSNMHDIPVTIRSSLRSSKLKDLISRFHSDIKKISKSNSSMFNAAKLMSGD